MKNIKLLNKIAKVGTDRLSPEHFNVGEDVAAPYGIMVRSASMLDMEFNPELRAIARAGAGVNNIPIERCTDAGIVVFNTPGANANAVKELVVCGLMLASRNVTGGVEWAKTLREDVAKQVEKGKSQFSGVEVFGKTLGVIGLGAIGGMVANAAVHLGMDVVGCDPYLSVEGAWNLNHHVTKAAKYEDVYAAADYITLHVPSTPQTKGMINRETIAKMKDGVRILNFSRADLVVASDVKEAMESGKIAAYVTDFPTEQVLDIPGAVAIPHLGASTEEAEDNCAVMAAQQLADYILNGNIRNSVNFPAVSMPRSTDCRLCILHKNVPSMLARFTALCSEQGINIENLTNKSRGDVAFTLIDVNGKPEEASIQKLKEMEEVMRVRVI
ncbi:MAG: phosphoglycerate dehydrogenase [Clostridia bacterium]|nr:phosphoglycerate dehydrogenase [Clostridia bacterium]